MLETPSRRRQARTPRLTPAHMTEAIKHISITALDPAKCNILVVKLPKGTDDWQREAARVACQALKEHGVAAYLIVPEEYEVCFAEQPAKVKVPA